MPRAPRIPGAALAALVALGVGGCHHRPAHPRRRPAPAFHLVAIDGRPLSLKALRGKVVLLDFWATWCEPCREEMPRLAALQRRDRARGLRVVGLSMDDEAGTVRAFLARHPLPYRVALASAGLAERYGKVLGLPTIVLVDRRGRIAFRHQGILPQARLEAEVDRVLAE